jgi:hypothetical protein
MAELIDKTDVKPSLSDYKKVFGRLHDNKTDVQLSLHYENCRDKAAEQFSKHPFWVDLRSELKEWDANYISLTGAEGLYKGNFEEQGQLNKKNWDAVFTKAFRQNVLSNSNWPSPPKMGWLTSDSWFDHVTDIVRTQFICRYIDGVEFIASKIVSLAEKHKLPFKNELKATNEGYYAGHVDVGFNFTIVDMEFNPVVVSGNVEFQVTTQLKEVVKQLLHIHYEDKRIKDLSKETEVWQWQYKEPSFEANYLGHVMHYLEAQILKLRVHHGNKPT